MLSLQLEPGDRLQRHLEAAGKALSGLIESAIGEGLLRVWAYPHPGPALAAALAFSHVHRLGVPAAFRLSIRPPDRIDVPTLLFGYPSLAYKASDVGARLVHIVHEERQRGHPPPGSVYLGVDGSLAVAYLMLADSSGLGGLTPELRAAGLAGIYLDGRVAPTGRLAGIDKVYVEGMAERGKPRPRLVTTIKVYKPLSRPLCDSMAATPVPPLPLARGGPDACVERLAAQGLRGAATKPAASLSSDELTGIVDAVLGLEDVELEASAIVSGLLVLEESPFEDPREVAHSMLYAAEALSAPEALPAALVDPETELVGIVTALERRAPKLVDWAWEARLARARGPGWLRIYTLEPRHESPSLAYLALQSVGLAPEDSVIGLVGGEGEIRVSPFQASLVDYDLPRRLVESRTALEDGFWLIIRGE